MFTEQEQYMRTKNKQFQAALFYVCCQMMWKKEHLLKTKKPGARAAARIFPFVPVNVTEVIILKSPAKPWL